MYIVILKTVFPVKKKKNFLSNLCHEIKHQSNIQIKKPNLTNFNYFKIVLFSHSVN